MALKILVAEDDRHTRRILEHIFTKDPAFVGQNVQLFLAPDGEEALKIFERESPDLVISDLLMPRLDGFALCRSIRRLPQGKDTAIIVTSAIYKETALLNRMRDELGVEFFAKPFQVRELIRGVQRLLEKRQRTQVTSPPAAPAQAAPVPAPPAQAAPALPSRGAPAREHRPTGELRQLRGDLARRPVPSLIFELQEQQATGVLTLLRGRITKEIFCIHGNPVGAESNLRSETLGAYLVTRSVLDEAQHQQALTLAKEQRVSLMQAIVQLGWLSETDVFRYHTALVKLRIISCLRWNDGEYQFAPGDTFSERIPKATIDVANIVFLGLQRVISLDEATKRLDQQSGRAIVLTPRAEAYRDAFVRVLGDDVLRSLPTRPSIAELLSKGAEPLKVYVHVHVLLECGMAELGDARADLGAPAAVPAEDPIGLRQLKAEATRLPEPRPAAGAAEGLLYEEIFGVDEISVVTSLPQHPESRPARAPAHEDLEFDIQLEEVSEGTRPRLSTPEARKLIVTAYLGLHDRSYYEILGVPRTAPPSAIHDAYVNLADRFNVDNFNDCDLGLDHPKLEEINLLLRQAYSTLANASARARYDEQLRLKESAPPAPDPLEAEARFQDGLAHLRRDAFGEAATQFGRALQIDPDSPDYHAHLGWALYRADPRNPARALEHLRQALTINPDEASAHQFLGKVHAELGQLPEAVQHLEQVLDLDPGNETAFEEVSGLYRRNGDWKLLERLHRKVIQRLGNRQPDRVVRLWKQLAAVYRQELSDGDSARMCLEVAAGLAPDDPEISASLRALARPDPRRWRETAEAILARWTPSPADPGPLVELFRLYDAAEQWDAAFVTASLLQVAGPPAPEEATRFYQRHRPRFLVRLHRELDADVWGRLRHPEDDPLTGSLFETLGMLGADFDWETEALPDLGAPLDIATLPAELSRVLTYLCGQLSMPIPPLHLRPDAAAPVTVVPPPGAPRLALSPILPEVRSTLTLGAAFARVLPYFWAGRAFGIALSTKQLKNVLMAAMKVVAPRLKVEDPSGAIDRIHQRLRATPPEVNQRLAETLQALTKERSSLNVSRWMKSIARSADRWALLVVGDLPTVVAAIPESEREDALADLRPFALSPDHLALRELLGVSVAV
jgi:CheY-like chemotaxis protein/tetratricopeptide (TPR) repeat protein